MASIELSIRISSGGGLEGKLHRLLPRHDAREIFRGRLVDRPTKGIWRILPAGRDHLIAFGTPDEFREAAAQSTAALGYLSRTGPDSSCS